MAARRTTGGATRSAEPSGVPASRPTVRGKRARARYAPVRSPQWNRPVQPMGYIPGLDGIRAVAVLGVLLYHAGESWLPGGFLGVDVFFVLSGFLISTILLEQLQARGGIDLRTFYAHRARRLLPALIGMVALCALLVVFFARDAAESFREGLLPSLFYVANWWSIADAHSYFEAIGRPSLLQHLWSLAIEEQFYLLWPLALLGLYGWRGRPGVARVALLAALGATLLMAVVAVVTGAPGGADASRLYYGTDTHCMGLLVGAALAAVWRPGALPRQLPMSRATALTLTGVAALAAVIACYVFVSDASPWMYRGGFLVFAAVVAVLIAVTTHPAARLGELLAVAPLVYIGKRSYGIYLYHWPIFMVTRPGVDLPFGGVPAFLVSVGLTFAVAEVSYRYLEVPVRNGTFGRTVRTIFGQGRARAMGVFGAAVVLALFVVALTLPASSGSDFLGGRTELNAGELARPKQGPPVTAPGAAGEEAQAPTVAAPQPSPTAKPVPVAAGAAPSPAPTSSESAQGGEQVAAGPAVRGAPVDPSAPVTMVGDSVSLGAYDTLAGALPNLTMDAAVSRQPSEIFSRILQRAETGELGDAVVIQSGTNGYIDEQELAGLLAALGDRQRVVLVTNAGPQAWQPVNDELMRSMASKYRNVRVADFSALAQNQIDWFVPDGVHLQGAGLEAYKATLLQALQAP